MSVGRTPRTGTAAAALTSFLSVALFATFAPPSNFEQPVLVVALAAIAAIAYSLKIWLEGDSEGNAGGTTFDATVVIALVALYIAGPLAALGVWLVPDLLHRCVFRRTPPVTAGLALNIASFAAGSLAGGAILAQADGAVGLALAGLAMVTLNFAISPLLYGFLFERPADRRELVAELVGLSPIIVLMLASGVGTALLVGPLGVAALGVLCGAIVLPEIRWRSLTERFPSAGPPPMADLERTAQATEELLTAVLSQVDAIVDPHSRHRSIGASPSRAPRGPRQRPRRRGHQT